MPTNIYMGNWRYALQSLDLSNKHVIHRTISLSPQMHLLLRMGSYCFKGTDCILYLLLLLNFSISPFIYLFMYVHICMWPYTWHGAHVKILQEQSLFPSIPCWSLKCSSAITCRSTVPAKEFTLPAMAAKEREIQRERRSQQNSSSQKQTPQ